ncbi:hypothetical protein DYB37_011695 [Aphanomyces astaci]|uniref:Apple domain-containing protein n=1 Tax=Aphanomyces astaci TaxID=112090 RepID=A0A3R6XJW2_APHAT|nr:hypothetical protein DYB37_011695 [Aphanomyces astaci]
MVSLTNALAVFGLAVLAQAQIPSFFDDNAQAESICNTDESQNVVCYKDSEPAKVSKSSAVARLKISESWCTGWLFGSEGHLITNNHCINNDAAAANTRVEFASVTPGCQDSVSLGSNPGVYATTNVTLILNDVKLDFALVKLNLVDGFDLAPYGYLQASETSVNVNDTAYVMGHPYGKPRRIAMVKDGTTAGRITTTNYTERVQTDCYNVDRLGHNLDTEGGSSGSPLMSATSNLVIGLHNCGGCKASTRAYGSNYAIKITYIVNLLREKNVLPKDAVKSSTTVSPTTTPTTTAPTTTAPTTTAPTTTTPTTTTPTTTAPSTTAPSTTATPTTTTPTTTPSTTTVPSTVAPVPSKCSPIEDNTDYAGFDVASTSRANAADCCVDCDSIPGCKLFVWSPFNGGTCWLKSQVGTKVTSVGVKSAVLTSPVTTSAPPSTPSPSLFLPAKANYDFPGNDISYVSSRQFKDCCAECTSTYGCNFYVWTDYNSGTCWLKSKQGSDKVLSFGSRAAFAPGGGVAPTCSPVEVNTDYAGVDIVGVAGPLDTCCDACKANYKCNAYSWFNGVCYLKGKRHGASPNSHVQSARVYKCAAPQVNTDYVGNDIGSVVAEAAEDCCAVCRSTAKYKAYS